MGRSTILWSIWLYRNDVIFNKKKYYTLICRLFSGQLIGLVSRPFCKKISRTFERGLPHIGDFSYSGLCQACVTIFLKELVLK
jgi:hypothetical protein